MTQPVEQANREVSRRTMLRGAAVSGVALPLLAACGGSDDDTTESGAGAGSGDGVTVDAADVPVGGGLILKDDKIVVTQPSEGTFMAFTAICTHQGCTVGSVEDSEIVCPCHGSHYSIEDGSPTSGPATAALAEKKVSVDGDTISVG